MPASIHYPDFSARRGSSRMAPYADPAALMGVTFTAAVTLTAAFWICGFALMFGGLRAPPIRVHGEVDHDGE